MKSLQLGLLVAIILSAAAITAAPAAAQDGYYRSYRPHSYRSLSRTGKYHGYWRDLGYGYNDRGTRGYYLPPVQVHNHYYGGYAPAYPAPVYPAPNYPAPRGYRY